MAALAHRTGQLGKGRTTATSEFLPHGMYGRASTNKVCAVARNFCDPKVRTKSEVVAITAQIMEAKKEVRTVRGCMSTMGVGLARTVVKEADTATMGYSRAKNIDYISRPASAQLWTPPPPPKKREKKMYEPKKKFHTHTQYSEADFDNEMRELADCAGYAYEQLRLLYRSFGRQTEMLGYFSEQEFIELLGRCNIHRQDVCSLIFKANARRVSGLGAAPLLTFRQAAHALSILGVGSRANQAESLFRCADVNRNRALSRAEMLRFIQENNPQGRFSTGRQRVEAFRTVGTLFDLLGAQRREEVPQEQFIEEVKNRDEVFTAFQNINPFQKYFHVWDSSDCSLQNVLNALFYSNDAKEHALLVRDRVEILAHKIDNDNSGSLDQNEIVKAVQVLYDCNLEDALEHAQQLCGSEGMSVANFVDAFTDLAEHNLQMFVEVEKVYGIVD